MPKGPVSASVYIWYPTDGKVGHASMYIGNYEVGKKFELALDPNHPNHIMPNAVEQLWGKGFDSVAYNQNYVSWWPDDEKEFLETAAEPMDGLYDDVDSEESEPHIIYKLYGLDVTKMRQEWEKMRKSVGKGAKYNLLRKNCSGMVAKVMRAGGAAKHLGKLEATWFTHNAIWTPHKVARWCNHMRPNYAEKNKAANCPEKTGWVTAVGMR